MDYTQYHALGQGEVIDPNDPNRTTAPAAQQFNPSVAPSPYQQQAPGPYGGPQGGPQYHGGPGSPAMAPPQTYGVPPNQGLYAGQPMPPQDGMLAAQMGNMNLGAADAHSSIRKKKKDRHAYHTVEAQGSSQAFSGMPAAGTQATQFLNSPGIPGTPSFGGHFASPQGTPLMGQSQFPTPGPNSPFSPAAPGFPTGNPAADASATIPSNGPAKVSPEDMPSVPAARDALQQHFLQNVYPTFERHVPPPASVSFVAFDQGNASPKYARLTMNNIPATSDGLAATGLPLGLILQPLAPLQAGEAEIPVLDFGEAGPPRCRRCRAYINPFMMFRTGGNKFVCNLCTYPNDTPPEYFCATNPQGVRVDRDQRPELHRGTVEFVVPKEYWTREPTSLRWLFLIDATQESYNKGFMETFCDGILAALYGGENQEKDENGEPKRRLPEGTKVGFVTYDKDIHFYNINVSQCLRSLSRVRGSQALTAEKHSLVSSKHR
jgi:protein transport protein SEC24